MKEPFTRRGDAVAVRLGDDERQVLRGLTDVIEAAGDADGRFAYTAHPNDTDAEDGYRALLGDSLDTARGEDRTMMTATLDSKVLDEEAAMAWMRVIGDARIALAHRLGIEDDSWEETQDPTDPETALLMYLGYLQDTLVRVLT
ncbi:MAG TPA: DUF2017 family protein [Acidimicrobiia bacterium]|nr:DUF2017 family protein [Acidimicrobiia bacterium]